MSSYLAVATGGAVGSVLRFWLAGLVSARFGEAFPWGTLVINVTGSVVIGFLGALRGPEDGLATSTLFRQLMMIGLCGGYTTFSAFSLQTMHLMQSGAWTRAGGNVVFSVVLCLAGVWAGNALALAVNSWRGY